MGGRKEILWTRSAHREGQNFWGEVARNEREDMKKRKGKTER